MLSPRAEGIVRARRAAAEALGAALEKRPTGFSERELADRWRKEIESQASILNYGWYQPPPNGMSVLIGQAPLYSRLIYLSLRSAENWPSDDIYMNEESILYPYFSAVDCRTGMIGDFVGTFYGGHNQSILGWIAEVYAATRQIAEFSTVGMTFAELFEFAQCRMRLFGASNNVYSTGGGLASDIGHTVPWFSDEGEPKILRSLTKQDPTYVATEIAGARDFISADNKRQIARQCAFTIEPQMLAPNLPMVSFHFIVIFDDGKRTIVSEFENLIEYFGMWKVSRS